MATPRVAARVPNQLKSALVSLTPREAKRAIYFDYEGIPTRPPVLLGWYIDGVYSASIVDSSYADCANRNGARQVGKQSHKAAAKYILRRFFSEKRHLVCWSWHDLKLIWPYVPVDRQTEFREHFVNAIRIARPWHKEHFGPSLRTGAARMSYFAGALGLSIPPQFGDHIVANCLTKVRKALRDNGGYADISPEDRAAWRTAVKHNQWDLNATAEICRAILEGESPKKGFRPPASVMVRKKKKK